MGSHGEAKNAHETVIGIATGESVSALESRIYKVKEDVVVNDCAIECKKVSAGMHTPV